MSMLPATMFLKLKHHCQVDEMIPHNLEKADALKMDHATVFERNVRIKK